MMIETIIEIESLKQFTLLLTKNPGLLIIKFGADWCSPCKRIESLVNKWFMKMPNNVQTVLVNIDKSIEIYSYLKNKKMLNGIPCILMYKKGNLGYGFDDAINNSNRNEIDQFFLRSLNESKNY